MRVLCGNTTNLFLAGAVILAALSVKSRATSVDYRSPKLLVRHLSSLHGTQLLNRSRFAPGTAKRAADLVWLGSGLSVQ